MCVCVGSDVPMYCPCDTCPYVTLETPCLLSRRTRGPQRRGSRRCSRRDEGLFLRKSHGDACTRGGREKSEVEPRCRQAKHVYRRRSSRAESTVEVSSPLDITAVGEVGVEILDAFIGLQVTDGHGESVSNE